MRHLLLGVSAIALLLAGCAADSTAPTVTMVEAEHQALTVCPTDAIDDPPQFQWEYQSGGDYYLGILEVSEVTLDIGGDTLTTRAYGQAGQPPSIPGPTITMQPGNKYVLRFHNNLPYEPLSTEHNVFRNPNASNIHTHGLHISGETPSDDVTRTFEGGFGGDFVYDIPADHMGGTYWYHAHHHGSTFLQVSGGTFGLLIIDDANDGMPANVAAMTERQIVLGYLDPGAAGTGGDTLMGGTLSPTWTINGHKSGSLCMPQDEWQRLRVLVADRDAKPKTVAFGANCEVKLLARDGVWRTSAPKDLPTGSISLTGASRADFAVRCSDDSTLSVAGNTVATIAVSGAGNPNVHPFAADGVSQWSAERPDYLRDLLGDGGVNTETIRMGARTVNGSKFDHDNATLTLPATDVQQWDLRGAAQHPFHLHIYHVQSVNCGGDYETGEYYDVMASNCAVRFDLGASTSTPYEGRTIMHCHILEHEDQGAMGWLDVEGGAPPPTFPSDTLDPPLAAYYALGVGPACDDGTCDAGEDTCSCPGDCGAPPASELSCDDGLDDDCDGNVDCSDADCDGDPACPVAPFCGDATCDAGEDQCSCAGDCGAPPSAEQSCTDGLDEDCDGNTDCDDADCDGDAACAVACDGDSVCEAGEDCSNCGSDCAGVQSGRPTNRYCCGNGVVESAEGDGSVCDGNY